MILCTFCLEVIEHGFMCPSLGQQRRPDSWGAWNEKPSKGKGKGKGTMAESLRNLVNSLRAFSSKQNIDARFSNK